MFEVLFAQSAKLLVSYYTFKDLSDVSKPVSKYMTT